VTCEALFYWFFGCQWLNGESSCDLLVCFTGFLVLWLWAVTVWLCGCELVIIDLNVNHLVACEL